jgi:scyllo-inositol 2-dehydrogenase (NADP+)
MKKVLYFYGGAPNHPTEKGGELLRAFLAQGAKYELDLTDDPEVFASLPGSDYVAVVLYATKLYDDLTPDREQGLLDFVRGGGGFVGLHSATDTFRNSRAFLEMLGGEFLVHPPGHFEFPMNVVDTEHYITARVPNFSLCEDQYHLQNYDAAGNHVLIESLWQGKKVPQLYVRSVGEGRVVYLGNGHTMETWHHPEYQKVLTRSVAWSAGEDLPEKPIRVGLLGYGPAFGMGQRHGTLANETPGMKTVAMCDLSPERVAAAKKELPCLEGYFTDLDEMLAMPDLDLITVILPHNLHARMAIKCLEAGKHVILEKPFSITVEEADAMIATAKERGLMLSLFHNRRWDGDYLTIKDVIARGLIGDIFHIEMSQGGYKHPGYWWRSDKEISGGVMYDWGAHCLDWILNLVPSKVSQVMGSFRKPVWSDVTNEDHGQAHFHFENGVVADYWVSSIAAFGRPKWLILGTKGAIKAEWSGKEITVASYTSGIRLESKVPVVGASYGAQQYYRNIADHLLLGEELAVTPESARRVIGVIDAAQRSSEAGHSIAPAPGTE